VHASVADIAHQLRFQMDLLVAGFSILFITRNADFFVSMTVIPAQGRIKENMQSDLFEARGREFTCGAVENECV